MDTSHEQAHQLRALAMRVAALEDNVAFLERWCEEQQDVLDRTAGPIGYDYETQPEPPSISRTTLRVVDLREQILSRGGFLGDIDADDEVVAIVETEHDRRVRQIRTQLNRIRLRLANTVAPRAETPRPRQPASGRVSATPAGRTAP